VTLPIRTFRTFLKPAFFLKPASLAYWNLSRDSPKHSRDSPEEAAGPKK